MRNYVLIAKRIIFSLGMEISQNSLKETIAFLYFYPY